MKQIVQNYKTGEVRLHEVPVPVCGNKRLLVRNLYSLVSIGTERSIIELGRKSLAGKALARPDLVRRAWEKAKKEGLLKTYQEALGRLDSPTPLGYSCAGVVEESGLAATEFSPGDRVACIGQGFASHAEFVSVPVNLACKLPDSVIEEEASFGMLGIISLHGIRCANLSFGSRVVVVGLGLLGLLSVQILQAYGCEVIAFDPVKDKVELAKKNGLLDATSEINELLELTKALTQTQGADAVIITAATKESGPVNHAIELSRFRGKIVVVGAADIHPERNELWNKEVEIVFGVASFKGNSPHEFNHALSFLHYNHLSQKITVPARPEGFLKLNQMAEEHINVQQAKKQLPSLLKTYLSFGGQIGEGAFIDRQLKTIDIFVFAEKSNIINKYKIS